MGNFEIKTYWSGYNKEEAINILNTEHPEKMMFKMKDGLFVIVSPEDFERAVKL